MSVKKLFTHPVRGALWRLLLVPEGPWVLLEDRDESQHEVHFAALQLPEGNPIWRDVAGKDRWWSSLHMATAQCTLLKTYGEGTMPQVVNTQGLATDTGEVLFDLEGVDIVQCQGALGYGYQNGETPQPIQVRLSTGEVTPLPTEGWAAAQNMPGQGPLVYEEAHPGFATIRAFVESRAGVTPQGATEYLETERGIGITWYVAEPPKGLKSVFWWLAPNGVLEEEVILGEGLPGIGQDTFMVWDQYLLVVKDKKELVGYAM